MSRIAVVGPGAIGGVLAAELISAAHHVTLCCQAPVEELVVEDATGASSRHAPSGIALAPADVPAVDWVILATKAHQTERAAGWLTALARKPEVMLAVAQNGVEHRERVGRWFAPERVAPVVVALGASRSGPGRVQLGGSIAEARLTVPASHPGLAFVELWRGTRLRAAASEDWLSVAWRKLAWNVAGGALTALTAQPMGVLRRPAMAALARGLVEEALAVGRAEGAKLEASLGDELVEAMCAGRPEATPSPLQDVRARRPLEHDARNGAVVRIGARHGIPTPLNAAVSALLDAISASFEADHVTVNRA